MRQIPFNLKTHIYHIYDGINLIHAELLENEKLNLRLYSLWVVKPQL